MEPNSSLLKCLTLLLSIVIFFISPIFLIFSIPLFILRYIIGKIVPWIKPGFEKMVTTRSSTLAADNPYDNPKSNLVTSLVLGGNVDFNLIRNHFIQIMESKFPNGDLVYPELKQYLTTWCGYYFWKADKSFDFNNHFSHYEKGKDDNGDKFTQADQLALYEKLINKKWDKKKPLWEMIVVTNYYPTTIKTTSFGPHTLYVLRHHHCLGDGFSILKFVAKFADNRDEFFNATPERIQKSLFEKLLYLLTTPFSLSFELAKFFVRPLINYPWKVPASKQKDTKCIIDMADQILISRIKEIKDHFKVSFTSVLFAILAGAERDLILKMNENLTDSLPAVTILPIPGHPPKLRNYMTVSNITLPIGEADPIKRLNFCSEDFKSLKKSYVPLLFFYSMMLVGSLFTPFIKLLTKNKGFPTGLTNFPAGKTTLCILGHKTVECLGFAGLQTGCAGVGIIVFSHGEGIRIATVASTDILTKEELRYLTSSIQKQIDILYQHVV